MPLLGLFVGYGGPWLTLLAALTWIAYARLPSIEDQAARWVAALSTPWVMKSAAVLAVAAWAWSFARQFAGRAYLRGAGSFSEISTVIAVVVLAAAIPAWWGARQGSPGRPWLTYGLYLAATLATGPLVLPGTETNLVQGSPDRSAVAFVQGRLAELGCFEAVGVPEGRDGTFDSLTASAVTAFQLANGLLADPRLDTPGVVRPGTELRLLSRPFPFLFGPAPCPDPSVRWPSAGP